MGITLERVLLMVMLQTPVGSLSKMILSKVEIMKSSRWAQSMVRTYT